MSLSEFFNPEEPPNETLCMVQLSTGMWSVRNQDGDRVGYFGFRSDAVEWLQSLGYGVRMQDSAGSTWERGL